MDHDISSDRLNKYMRLSRFNEAFQKNVAICSDHFESQCILQETIADIFHELLSSLSSLDDANVASLINKSCCSYMTASILGMGGVASESFAASRLCIESGITAYYAEKKNLFELYFSRDDSPGSKVEFRKLFAMSKMEKFLKSESQDIYRHFSEVYEHTITCGGHTNPQSLMQTVRIEESKNFINMKFQLVTSNEETIMCAIQTAARSGVTALEIFQLLFRKHFDDLGLTERINKAKGAISI